MSLADTARLAVQLDLKGNFTANLRASQKALGQFDTAVTRSQGRAYKAGQQIGTGLKNVGRITVGALTAGAGIVAASLKVAGDFEAQLNTINTIAHKTPTELGAIGDSIRKVARDTGTGLDDLTQGYYDLLSAGVKAADAQKVLTAANALAIGGLSTTAESIDLLTTAINTYGGDATKATQYTDIFAKAIERGKVTAAELAQSFAQVGPIAASSGISISELSAGYARLTAAGVPAAEAATQMRSAIVALTRTSKPLEDLQKQTGRNYLSIAGKKGLVEALEIMRKDAAKAGVPLIDLLGRVEGLNFTLATTGPNFAAYNADLAAMGDASGTAADQMAERQQGLNFQLARLKALAKDAGITIGSALLPRITPLVAKLNEFVNLNQDKIKDFGTAVAGLFSDANIKSGIDALKTGFETAKTAAPVVAAAAKSTLGFVQAAVSLFRSLPAPLQGILAGGIALNKLTGGLVTNVAGGIIESVGKQFFQRGSSPANPLFVTQVGGIPGAPGGGGGIGSLLKGAAAVALGAIAFDLYATKLAPLNEANAGQTTAIADSVAKNLQSATVDELKLQRDAVIKGFNDLQAATSALGPLQGVLYGSQIDVLKGQIDVLSGELERRAKAGGPIGGSEREEALLGATKDQTRAAEMNARRIEAAENRTGNLIDSSGRTIAKQVTASTIAFRRSTANLRDARGTGAIAAALKATLAKIFVEGKGGSGGAANVLKVLRAQLKNTHDPALTRALRTAIARVEVRMASRRVVEAQLKRADEIARSSKTNVQKIKELKDVQRLIGNKNAGALKRVQEKIDAAKKAQVTATNAVKRTLASKDFSVAIANTINVAAQISSRAITTVTARQNRYYNVPT